MKASSEGASWVPHALAGYVITEVAYHYELIGDASPLNALTFRQAEGLRPVLPREGIGQPVYVGMRNRHPFLHEALAGMRGRGNRRTLGIILSPFQTEAS
jgi:ferrochelatase